MEDVLLCVRTPRKQNRVIRGVALRKNLSIYRTVRRVSAVNRNDNRTLYERKTTKRNKKNK